MVVRFLYLFRTKQGNAKNAFLATPLSKCTQRGTRYTASRSIYHTLYGSICNLTRQIAFWIKIVQTKKVLLRYVGRNTFLSTTFAKGKHIELRSNTSSHGGTHRVPQAHIAGCREDDASQQPLSSTRITRPCRYCRPRRSRSRLRPLAPLGSRQQSRLSRQKMCPQSSCA